MPVARPAVIAVDAGTTGVRAVVVDAGGRITDLAYLELTQFFPGPGRVEHDPDEIRDAVAATLAEVAARLDPDVTVASIGITNQRETVVAWDRRTGRPLHRALVWQDRRTAGRCAALDRAGHLPTVRARTGLVLDPYFSATKLAWLLEEGGVEVTPDLVLGTVDSWVLWNLTGGTSGGVLATDTTNASRTLLFDIDERTWSEELCDLFGVPGDALVPVVPSCGRVGVLSPSAVGALAGTPISALAGDQHAALFGQACFATGMAKATFGTGTFVLVNAGAARPGPAEGLLTTVAWDLGDHAGGQVGAPYAVEGSVLVAGAAVQWLRDGLSLIDDAAELGPLAATVDSAEGVVFVPALAGLGSPYWDPYARGVLTGLSRGTGRGHIARATVEALAHQVADVVGAMGAAGTPATDLRVDGGASAMDLLLATAADLCGATVSRPVSIESTALGAAHLAGLAEGVWASFDELAALRTDDVTFTPTTAPGTGTGGGDAWRRAVDRARRWARPEPSEGDRVPG